jgi:hypothetical protein
MPFVRICPSRPFLRCNTMQLHRGSAVQNLVSYVHNCRSRAHGLNSGDGGRSEAPSPRTNKRQGPNPRPTPEKDADGASRWGFPLGSSSESRRQFVKRTPLGVRRPTPAHARVFRSIEGQTGSRAMIVARGDGGTPSRASMQKMGRSNALCLPRPWFVSYSLAKECLFSAR